MIFSQLQTVLLLCTVALTSATNPDSGRRGPNRGPPSSRPGDTCYNQLISCYRDRFEKYDKDNTNRTLAAVHQAGFAQVCQDVDSAIECAEETLQLDDCGHLPKHVLNHADSVLGLGNYVCEYYKDEASQHFDCLLNTEVFARISRCIYKTETEDPCDHEPIAECASNLVRLSTPECTAGADDLTYALIIQLSTLGPCRL